MDTNNRPLGESLTESETNEIQQRGLVSQWIQKIKHITIPKVQWTWIVGLRIVIIIGTAIGMLFNTLYGIAMPSTTIDCVLDKTYVVTNFMNSFLSSHSTIKKAFIIITSLYTDCMILYSLLHWSFYGKSLRLLMSLCLYYIAHTVIRLFFFVEYPPSYLWEAPAFPSLFVSYIKSNSTFFTNCVGLLMICMMEWKENRKMIQMIITLVCIVLECFIMHSLHAHYVIDLFSGLFIGHYIYILVGYFVVYLDKRFELKNGDEDENEKIQEKLMRNQGEDGRENRISSIL